MSGSVSHRSRPQSTRAERLHKKKLEQQEQMEEAAQELLNHFNHRNLDALLKAVRYTLEGLRKRITASTLSSYVLAGQCACARVCVSMWECGVVVFSLQ